MTDIINAQNRRDNAIDAINNSNMSEDEKNAAIDKVNNDFGYVVATTLNKEGKNKPQNENSSSYTSSVTDTSTSKSAGCLDILLSPITLPIHLTQELFQDIWEYCVRVFDFIVDTKDRITTFISDIYNSLMMYHYENRAPEVKKNFKNEQEKIKNAKDIISHYQSERRPYRKYTAYTLSAGTALVSSHAAITSKNETELIYALVPLVYALWLGAYCSRNKTHDKNKCLKKVGKIFPEIKNDSDAQAIGIVRAMQYGVILSSLALITSDANLANKRLNDYTPEKHEKYCQKIGKEEAPLYIYSLLWIGLYGLGARITLNTLQKSKLNIRKNAIQLQKHKELLNNYINE